MIKTGHRDTGRPTRKEIEIHISTGTERTVLKFQEDMTGKRLEYAKEYAWILQWIKDSIEKTPQPEDEKAFMVEIFFIYHGVTKHGQDTIIGINQHKLTVDAGRWQIDFQPTTIRVIHPRKIIPKKRYCEICGKEITDPARRKLCSPECRREARRLQGIERRQRARLTRKPKPPKPPKEPVMRTCPICGKIFAMKNSRQIYCGSDCRRYSQQSRARQRKADAAGREYHPYKKMKKEPKNMPDEDKKLA